MHRASTSARPPGGALALPPRPRLANTPLPRRLVHAVAAAAQDEGDAFFEGDDDAGAGASDGSPPPPARRAPAPRSRLEAKQSTRLRSQLRAMLPDPVDDPLFDAAALLTSDDDGGDGAGGSDALVSPAAAMDSLADPASAARRRAGQGAPSSARPQPPAAAGRSAAAAAYPCWPPRPSAPPPQRLDREAIAHIIVGGYHHTDDAAAAEEAAMRLLTEQRGRDVSVYGQTVAMAGLMEALDAEVLDPDEEFIPDWIVATFGLERCWQSLEDEEAARSGRTMSQEAWAPDRELVAAVARGEERLLAGLPATTPAVEEWGGDTDAAYRDLLEGVLPGVEEGGGAGGMWLNE